MEKQDGNGFLDWITLIFIIFFLFFICLPEVITTFQKDFPLGDKIFWIVISGFSLYLFSKWLIRMIPRIFGRIKNWLFFLFVWGMYIGLRKLSMKTRYEITKFVAKIIYRFHKPYRERIKRNIALIRPDLFQSEIDRVAEKAVEAIARSWAAMLGNESVTLDEIAAKLDVEGIETLLDYYHRGEKIIATGVHVGPMDEMVGIVPIYELKVYVPAESINPKWFFELMKRLRLRFKGIIFDPVEKGKILTRAAHHLSHGRIVVFVLDIPKGADSGVLCQIGNGKARFPVGAVKLALEQDATIFPAFTSWDGCRIKVVIGSPFNLIRTGDLEQDIETNTRRLIEEVYAPHIQENVDSWLRLLWINLEPVVAEVTGIKKVS